MGGTMLARAGERAKRFDLDDMWLIGARRARRQARAYEAVQVRREIRAALTGKVT